MCSWRAPQVREVVPIICGNSQKDFVTILGYMKADSSKMKKVSIRCSILESVNII